MKLFSTSLLFRMIMDKAIHLFKRSPLHKNWNPQREMAEFTQNGLIEKFKIVKTEDWPFARIIARVRYRGKSAIFKMHVAHRLSTHLAQINNELTVIHIANKNITKNSIVRFPEILYTNVGQNRVYGIREYLKGTQLMAAPTRIMEAYDACLSSFNQVSSRLIAADTAKLPRRSPLSMIVTFPVLTILALIKNTFLARDIWTMIILFIKHVSFHDIFFPRYVLAHRDLSSENILVIDGGFGVIDAEVAALCEKGTDLALFPRFYYQLVSENNIIDFLKEHLHTSQERSAFIRLTIYYTFHYLAICAANDVYYDEARKYIHFFTTKLYTAFKTSSVTPYEGILRLLLSLPLKLGFPLSAFTPRRDFILCYHSIAYSHDRYTMPPDKFIKQIAYLRRHATIVPLPDILSGDRKKSDTRVSITFDDGYRDTYTTAFPYLCSQGIVATVFIIGNTMRIGKRDHYLNKEIMTVRELNRLRDAGWEIGFHTRSHQDLRTCTANQLHSEMTGGKTRIEKYIGSPLRYFAYPFGGYTKTSRSHLTASGFTAGFTTDSGTVLGAKLTAIPRVDIEGSLTLTEFYMLCSDYGLWISSSLMRLLRGKIYIEEKLMRRKERNI